MELQPRIEYIKCKLTKICNILPFDALVKQLEKFKVISKEKFEATEEDAEGNRIVRLATIIAKKNEFNLLLKAVGGINRTLRKYLKNG